ncbi:hypothetical protein AV274_6027 [Blastocystis sp. ATCC 50177/Nand II]|uniref:Uncharacterized protein n=1 Tax=Blastocystis sp. subtype 1 (strain ATCC 50177 / NandII) TaxID=478820 RepID=A0A196S5D7_BLAHN|nr:hypothetical protein AV274_6027 [Blastocystis sp. ATCC 50177/Nand II]
MLWELEERHWRSIGVFALNTLRITGVSIACYPTIVLTTWEGNVVVEEWSTAATSAQRLLSLPHHKSDLSAGDCCGSFVQFDASSGVFVISRAISQELFLLDETLSMVLFSAHFDTFFRGLVVASSCVFAFTNGGVFSFFMPAMEWLKACPLCLDHFRSAEASSSLSDCRMKHAAQQCFGALEVEVHANHLRIGRDGSWRVLYLRKRVLDVCLLSDTEIMLANAAEVFVVDAVSLQKIASCELDGNRIHEMTIIQHGRNEVYLVYGWTNERREAAVSFQRGCFHDSGNEVEMELMPPRTIPKESGDEPRTLVDVKDNTPVFE